VNRTVWKFKGRTRWPITGVVLVWECVSHKGGVQWIITEDNWRRMTTR
jgi:hypothetical protein